MLEHVAINLSDQLSFSNGRNESRLRCVKATLSSLRTPRLLAGKPANGEKVGEAKTAAPFFVTKKNTRRCISLAERKRENEAKKSCPGP